MASRTITKQTFASMIKNGAINLKNHYREVDDLNVFPVPDGDTGTNMQLTMMAGVKKILDYDESQGNFVDFSKTLSKALLFGARGNSGTILAQFWHGFEQGLENVTKNEMTINEFIKALKSSCKAAYKVVQKPVEGTILTVMKEATNAVIQHKKEINSIEECMAIYVDTARVTLAKTPDMLPVLKESGVVDSGGAGFLKIIEGMQMYLDGTILEETELNLNPINLNTKTEHEPHNFAEKEIVFGYCTEFIIKLFDPQKFSQELIETPLSKLGDSMVVVVVDDLLKVHVHTNEPGVVITLAQKYGDLQTIKVENMRLQHQHILDEQKQTKQVAQKVCDKKYGIIAVCSGDGIAETFRNSGADYIITGGQTMNPSTQDFAKAIEAVNANHIIIIPNNSNVILTAEQTKEIFPDRDIYVVKTKNIAQGYAAIMLFDEFQEFDVNQEVMSQVITQVGAGEITYAVRDTVYNGLKITKGNFIGIANNEIKTCCEQRFDCFKQLIKNIYNEDRQLLTIFYGKDVTEEELETISNFVHSEYEDIELELIKGNQDIYSYIVVFE